VREMRFEPFEKLRTARVEERGFDGLSPDRGE
jgi:hypothetical protein